MTVTLTPPPSPAPSRTMSVAEFSLAADADVAWQATNVTEMTAALLQVEADAATAAAAASAAASSASAAGAIIWVTGTTYAIGDQRWSPANFQTYRRKTAGAGATDPSADSTNWARVVLGGAVGATAPAAGNIVLTAASTAFQRVNPSGWNQYVQLPDATTMLITDDAFIVRNNGEAPVRLVDSAGSCLCWIKPFGFVSIGLRDISSAAGRWTITGDKVGLGVRVYTEIFNAAGSVASADFLPVPLDANRTLVLMSPASGGLYGVVFDKAEAAGAGSYLGSVTLIRASVVPTQWNAIKTATDRVMVVSAITTAMQTVILSVAGLVITVNTPTATTIAGNIAAIGQIVAVSTSWVVPYTRATTTQGLRAITISGTTPTVGSESAASTTGTNMPHLYASASIVLAIGLLATSSTGYAKPYTVATSTLTLGTASSAMGTSAQSFRTLVWGTRWLILWNEASASVRAGLISLAGTVASQTSVSGVIASNKNALTEVDAIVASNSRVIVSGGTIFNTLIDTAGTVSAGTPLTTGLSGIAAAIRATAGDSSASFLVGGYHVYVDATSVSPTVHIAPGSASGAVAAPSAGRGATYSANTTFSGDGWETAYVIPSHAELATVLPNYSLLPASTMGPYVAPTAGAFLAGSYAPGNTSAERWVLEANGVLSLQLVEAAQPN